MRGRRLRRQIRRILLAVAVVFAILTLSARRDDSAFNLSLSWNIVPPLDPSTEQTLDDLEGLEGLIQVTAFSSERIDESAGTRDARVRQFLAKMSGRSKVIETRFINMDTERDQARALHVTQYGSMLVQGFDQRVDISADQVFRMEGRGVDRKLKFMGEAPVARAISQILSGATSRVYLLSGHGEPSRSGEGIDGLASFSSLLEAEGYRVRDLDLRPGIPGAATAVPDDADLLMMVGPTRALSEGEARLVERFVEHGGAFGCFLDPGVAPPEILGRTGVILPPGHVVSESGSKQAFGLLLGDHAIVNGLGTPRPMVWVSRARSLLVEEGRTLNGAALLISPVGVWNELGGTTPPRFDPSVDGRGPVIVGVSTSWRGPEAAHPSRVVVIGDSDFVRNQALYDHPGNALFAVNAVRWLVEEDDRLGPLARRPPDLLGPRTRWTDGQLAAMRWGGIAFLLTLLGLSGPLADLWLRWRQRRRGGLPSSGEGSG